MGASDGSRRHAVKQGPEALGFVYGISASIAVCTAATTSPASEPIILCFNQNFHEPFGFVGRFRA
jgi:hypothetical protein